MPSLKDVKTKIVGIGKTKQITKAMNMVASAKLRNAQARIEGFRPYAQKYRDVIGELAAGASGHALLTPHANPSRARIIIITSDRGLCGGFNANIIAAALKLAAEKKAGGMQVAFDCVGRKGRDAIRRSGNDIDGSWVDVMGRPEYADAAQLGARLVSAYDSLEIDEAWVVYGEFVSMAHQPPRVLSLLPLKAPEAQPAEGPQCEYIYEPSEARLLEDLLPRYLNVQIYRAMLDTGASEHAARMAAMDNATRNCNELINSLTLLYNKTRQASITSELIDIVGGAEALKG